MSQLVGLIGLSLAAVVGVVLLDRAIARPVAVLWAIVATTFLDAAFENQLLGLRYASVKILLTDVLFGIVAAAGVARHLRLRSRPGILYLVYGFGLLALLSVARGVPLYGESALNEFRFYLAFAGTILYFSSVAWDQRMREAFARSIVGLGVALGVLVVLRWANVFAGLPIGPLQAEFGRTIAVLSGPQSFPFAEAFFVTLPAIGGRERLKHQRVLAVAFLAFGILLNRRTMWLAMLVGAVVLASRNREWAKRMAGLGLVLVLVGATAYLVLPPEQLPVETEDELAFSPTDTGTLEWRLQGWAELVRSMPDDIVTRLIGEPSGAGYQRDVEVGTVGSNPHSLPVQTLLRTGALGLLALLALYGLVIRGLMRYDRPDPPGLVPIGILLTLVVVHGVWILAWRPGPEQSVLLGLAVSAVIAGRAGGAGRALPAWRPRESVPRYPAVRS